MHFIYVCCIHHFSRFSNVPVAGLCTVAHGSLVASLSKITSRLGNLHSCPFLPCVAFGACSTVKAQTGIIGGALCGRGGQLWSWHLLLFLGLRILFLVWYRHARCQGFLLVSVFFFFVALIWQDGKEERLAFLEQCRLSHNVSYCVFQMHPVLRPERAPFYRALCLTGSGAVWAL